MKRIGTVSYNKYYNFSNYGSILQTWALHQAIKRCCPDIQPVLVDYCMDCLMDKNPLEPFANMWDQNEEAKRRCELSLLDIERNHVKMQEFIENRFVKTKGIYNSSNFNSITCENLDGFLCGSDTIFCVNEFGGFDQGFFANYECMKNKSVTYAASFSDLELRAEEYRTLDLYLQNFKAIGLRESFMLDYVKRKVSVPVQKCLDPTLLLDPEDYSPIESRMIIEEPYLLLYSRRNNPQMDEYAEKVAEKNGWRIVEISLNKSNEEKGHVMYYSAGVEEFLSLIKYAEYVVTNSFHGLIFSVQYKKRFSVFTREYGNRKIRELVNLLGLDCLNPLSGESGIETIDYSEVFSRIKTERYNSLQFLKQSLSIL